AHALGQRVGVRAGARTEAGATTDEDVRLAGAVARAPGALLRVDLGGRAGDLGARLGRRGAAAPLRELPGDHFVENGFLGLGQVERDLTAAADNVYRDRHQLTFLLDWRTTTTPPLGPGMAPFTSRRLSSGRTSITSRASVVMVSWP